MIRQQLKIIDGGWEQHLEEVAQYILHHPVAPENEKLLRSLEPAGYDKVYLICHEGQIIDPVYAKPAG